MEQDQNFACYRPAEKVAITTTGIQANIFQ